MKYLFLFGICFLFFSCASKNLIKDSEYNPSIALFKQSEFQKSLEQFPKKEDHGFITSVEKAWISLWNQKGDNSDLERQIQSLDSRKYISLSKETEYFFFNESEDGYIPAEHEIISLHLINAMIYMQQKKWTDAEVEARRASYFLQNIFSTDQPHFDDPALRLWLAAVWMSLGDWNEAQVDLRKIYELTQKIEFKKLAESQAPPQNFKLIFKGSGPELIWNNSSDTPEFNVSIPFTDGHGLISDKWYQRHQARNTAIRDVALKSNYMTQYLGIKTNSNSQKAAGYTLGTAAKVVGVTIGGVLIVGGIYLAAQSGVSNIGDGIGYIFLLGYAIGTYFWDEGERVIRNTVVDANNYEKNEFDKLHTYRFVRFLPNEISFQTNLSRVNSELSNHLHFENKMCKINVEFFLVP